MTEASTDTVRTLLDTLQPTCTAKNLDTATECAQPAAWTIRLTQLGHTVTTGLHCDQHQQHFAGHYASCPVCRDVCHLAYHAEPLRGGQ